MLHSSYKLNWAKAMFIKKLIIIFFVITSVFCTSAYANPNIVTFGFTGSVIFSDPSLNAPIDSPISGSFSYDLNAPITTFYNSPPTTYSYYYYSAPEALSVNFSGHSVTSDLLTYTLFDNFSDNLEDQLILDAGLIKLDGIDSGGLSIVLSSSPWIENTNALTSSQPPQTLDLSLFNVTPYNSGSIVVNNAYKLQFSILSITPVPEPESYALLLAGLGIICFKVRRKA